jgi:hypothetical protein
VAARSVTHDDEPVLGIEARHGRDRPVHALASLEAADGEHDSAGVWERGSGADPLRVHARRHDPDPVRRPRERATEQLGLDARAADDLSGSVDNDSGHESVRPVHQALDRGVRSEHEPPEAGARDGERQRRVGGVEVGQVERGGGAAADNRRESPDDHPIALGDALHTAPRSLNQQLDVRPAARKPPRELVHLALPAGVRDVARCDQRDPHLVRRR